MGEFEKRRETYFTFTGNPIIDNGIAVLTLIAGKKKFEDVTPNDITNNLEQFFNTIKNHFNDEHADKKEKEFIKKKLKQHLTSLYTTNHYLHGINNKSVKTFNVKLITKYVDELKKEIIKKDIGFKTKNFEEKKEELKFQIYSSNIITLNKIAFEKILKKNLTTDIEYKVKTFARATIETNEEYFDSFNKEVKSILDGSSGILSDPKRRTQNNICNFCSNNSDIKLSKDLFPLISSIADFNLGNVFVCRYCYLASLFSFFNYINFKKDEKQSGMYFFYHFSNPSVMLDYTKQQIKKLQDEKLASLQTKIGGKYNSAFEDLFEKIRSLKTIEKYHPSVTIYFLLNDNRRAIYDNLSLPNGLLNFWLSIHNANDTEQWAIIHKNLNNTQDYNDFVNGSLSINKFKNNNKRTVISYLKEVTLMDENTIKECENLSKNLIKYFKELHSKNPTRRDHWTAEFSDYFKFKKPYEFFNSLFEMNNNYFRWTEGENLVSISSAKILLQEYKKYNLLFNLLEYFILNNLNEEDKTKYFEYKNKKTNIGGNE